MLAYGVGNTNDEAIRDLNKDRKDSEMSHYLDDYFEERVYSKSDIKQIIRDLPDRFLSDLEFISIPIAMKEFEFFLRLLLLCGDHEYICLDGSAKYCY